LCSRRICATVLQEKLQREKNEPLTLEELKIMDSKPVWVTWTSDFKNAPPMGWHLVDLCFNHHHWAKDTGIACVARRGSVFCLDDYEKTWLAYRYKKEVQK